MTLPETNENAPQDKPLVRCRDCAYFTEEDGVCVLLAVFAEEGDGCTFGITTEDYRSNPINFRK